MRSIIGVCLFYDVFSLPDVVLNWVTIEVIVDDISYIVKMTLSTVETVNHNVDDLVTYVRRVKVSYSYQFW